MEAKPPPPAAPPMGMSEEWMRMAKVFFDEVEALFKVKLCRRMVRSQEKVSSNLHKELGSSFEPHAYFYFVASEDFTIAFGPGRMNKECIHVLVDDKMCPLLRTSYGSNFKMNPAYSTLAWDLVCEKCNLSLSDAIQRIEIIDREMRTVYWTNAKVDYGPFSNSLKDGKV